MQQVNLEAEFEASNVKEVLDKLDRELIGLIPVKTRIREIAALLLVDRLRKQFALTSETPTLHMNFTGNPGTGKTTVAMRMAEILHRLGYVREGHLVSVTRDDLVGQYIGHTAPKTKEVIKKAMGGVLFIDEAYYLYKPENERDYGAESIEILLQTMENNRDDLVVILAGYKDRMDKFFHSNPGMRSRIAHHVDFPDYSARGVAADCQADAGRPELSLQPRCRKRFPGLHQDAHDDGAFCQCTLGAQRAGSRASASGQRLFANASKSLSKSDLMTLEAEDILASRVFLEGKLDLDGDEGSDAIED